MKCLHFAGIASRDWCVFVGGGGGAGKLRAQKTSGTTGVRWCGDVQQYNPLKG